MNLDSYISGYNKDYGNEDKSQTTSIEAMDFLSEPIKSMRLETNLDDGVLNSLLMPFYYLLGLLLLIVVFNMRIPILLDVKCTRMK